MQMYFNFSESPSTQPGQGVQVIRLVLPGRVEERVLRRLPVAVAEFAEPLGVFLDPPADPLLGLGGRRAAESRLVVVGDAQKEVNGVARSRCPATLAGEEVRDEPAGDAAPGGPHAAPAPTLRRG